MEADLVGTVVLDKLRVVRRLGSGATGVVHEVEHTVTGHRRALKILRGELGLSGEAATRFVREAKIASLVRSPFLVDTLDAGRMPDGSAYLLMELAEGRSWRSLLEASGRLEPARAVRLALDVCAGLEAVHDAGFVHRDLKPENLLVSPVAAPPGERAMILDFGLCKALEPSLAPSVFETITREGAAPGTPAYLAPERLEVARGVSPSADLWALGVVLFESLAGRRPFEGPTAAAVISAIRRASAPPLATLAPDVQPALASVVDRMLSRAPAGRYATAREVAEALSAASDGGAGRPADRGPGGAVLADRYRVVRPLGRGGAGAVLEVVDEHTGARRALKLLHVGSGDARAIARLRREAELGARLGLVAVHDLGEDSRAGVFLVMDLLEGKGLDARLSEGPLGRAEVLEIARALATDLARLHAAGVVHRDLKPSNVFLEATSDGARVRLLDLGVAKVLDEATLEATADGTFVGTPIYAPPEQLERSAEVGPPADLYGLAHTVFAALVGRPYFDAEAKAGVLPLLAAIGAGCTERASRRAARVGVELPRAFDEWFARATARDASDRFSSAAALVVGLEGALDATLGDDRRTDGELAVSTTRRARTGGRSRSAVVAAVLVAVVGLGVGVPLVRRPSPDELIAERVAPQSSASPTPIEGGGDRAAPRPTFEPPASAASPSGSPPVVSARPLPPRGAVRPPPSAHAAAASAGVPPDTFF